jgi:hypothetical protein
VILATAGLVAAAVLAVVAEVAVSAAAPTNNLAPNPLEQNAPAWRVLFFQTATRARHGNRSPGSFGSLAPPEFGWTRRVSQQTAARAAVAVDRAELFRAEIRTRIPFKYGIATMVDVPHVFVRLTVITAAGAQTGIAADHLPPKWFTKDPARSIADEIEDMMSVVTHALIAARSITAPDVFAFWDRLRDAQAHWAGTRHFPPLLAQFGTSLVERALLDAVARQSRTNFLLLLQQDRLGFRPGDIHPELGASRAADLLPRQPAGRIHLRHTVGLADPLTDRDAAGQSPDDGLPHSLEACIRRYGLRHFKLKIDGGASDRALARLRGIAEVLFANVSTGLAVSVDGNESFGSAEAFRDFWQAASADPQIERLLRHLLFVEQPLARATALDPQRASFVAWPDRPPIIIDESDAEPGDLRQALDLGYAGTSHKNCKGIFKGVAHACLIAQRNARGGGPQRILSGEDLCTIGPVAMLQDLALQAILGVSSVERNGHHYFAGLSIWPRSFQDAILRHHPDLYERSERGWPALTIASGTLSTRSVVVAPLGVGPELPLEDLGPAHAVY